MKKLVVLLTLFVAFSVEAQMYSLEYTTYAVKKKQYTETPTKSMVYLDMDHNNIYVMKDGVRILDVIALSSKEKSNGDAWINCVDYKTKLVWDIYITTFDSQYVFQAKSKKSEFWLKEYRK